VGKRQDAVHNRARLVAAAREVFAERGLGATLDDIAARAGVGTGTAYRHFRNKRQLAAEVLADATQQIVVDAEEALRVEDPWLGIVTFFETTAARQAADRGLYQVLAGQGGVADKVRIWPQIVAAVNALFVRARDAGVVRADTEPADAAVIFAMLGVVYDGPPELWRRYLALLLDGLRATDRPALPVAPPQYTTLDDVIAVSKGHRRAREPR
jgi:AcrR family transcriptional regulator